MSAPVSWIDEAKEDYKRRPWVAWALRLRVPPHEELVTLQEAARAIAFHVGPRALPTLVSIELAESSRGKDSKQVHALLLLRTVAKELVGAKRCTEQQAIDAVASAYLEHGIDLRTKAKANAR